MDELSQVLIVVCILLGIFILILALSVCFSIIGLYRQHTRFVDLYERSLEQKSDSGESSDEVESLH